MLGQHTIGCMRGAAVLILSQTYIGHVLVSVNPFRDCKFHSQEDIGEADNGQWVSTQTPCSIPIEVRTDSRSLPTSSQSPNQPTTT